MAARISRKQLKELKMSALRRAYSVIEFKDFDEQKREFEGIATTVGVDRYGDIVESEGAVFNLPIPLLWQHNASAPVGHVNTATPQKKQIKVKGSIVKLDEPGTLKDRLDEAWQSLKTGLVRHLSIGFNPLEYSRIESEGSWGLHFLKWEWLELSLVTIPANADASVTSIKRFDDKLRFAASGNHKRSFAGVPLVRLPAPGVSGKNAESKTGLHPRAVKLSKLQPFSQVKR